MAIGKDIYCDSRLIIQKLEQLYPHSTVTPPSPFEEGIRKLFQSWTIDGGIFANAVKLIPASGFLKDTKFLDDRQKLMGGKRMTPEAMQKGRPDGLIHIRQAFELLETTFLADGRTWILATEAPTTADIDAVWPFTWLVSDRNMHGSLPPDLFSSNTFPKTYAYIARFKAEVAKAKKANPFQPTHFSGQQMKHRILNASAAPEKMAIIPDDPLQLAEGEEIEVYASDYGSTHRDRGALVGLTSTEVVIRNALGLHLHFPRWNFRIERAQVQSKASAMPTSVPKTPDKEWSAGGHAKGVAKI
jgi:glutathione S-transferase